MDNVIERVEFRYGIVEGVEPFCLAASFRLLAVLVVNSPLGSYF
jgi:hypothetical protein